MKTFAARQIEEIRTDRALSLYGAALAIANVLTFVQWKFFTGVPLMIARGAASQCWPFWGACHDYQMPVAAVNAAFWGYLLLSVVAAWWFARGRRIGGAYWLLVLVNAFRVAVMFQDYRLRANHHYMLNWVLLPYLVLPGKRALAHHVLASLYFWAGTLKLDPDWLSGASLYSQDRLWIPQALVPAACVYVLFLEMVFVWGIYARRRWIFLATVGQLLLFHYTSWPIVGFWYPTLMVCLLSILPLSRVVSGESIPVFWRDPWPWRRAVATALVAIFGLLQMIPHAFPGDTAMTGEGRMFALHMFDALVECEATVTYHYDDGRQQTEARPETTRLPHRSRCDPLIYYSLARNLCEGRDASRKPAVQMVDLDLRLRSKRNSADVFQPVLDLPHFCSATPRYSMWHHNDWIQVPARNAGAPRSEAMKKNAS